MVRGRTGLSDRRRGHRRAVYLGAYAGAHVLPPLCPSEEVAAETEQDGKQNQRKRDHYNKTHLSALREITTNKLWEFKCVELCEESDVMNSRRRLSWKERSLERRPLETQLELGFCLKGNRIEIEEGIFPHSTVAQR